MAGFANKPLLDVDLDVGSKRASVAVSGRISFSEIERQLMQSGLAIIVKGKLVFICELENAKSNKCLTDRTDIE